MIRCPFRFLYSTPSAPSAPLAQMLRERTADAHKKAEHHPLQQALVRGRVTRDQFVRVANEMRHVHLAGRPGMEKLATEDRTKALAAAIDDREEMFVLDLAAFGVGPAAEPSCPATRKLADRIRSSVAQGNIGDLVGHAYVMQGITNSGYYIAQAVERTLRLEPGQGTTWLNPYRDEVRARWEECRKILDAVPLNHHETEAAVAGARSTFDLVGAVMKELRN